ncbi:MAG: YjjW family glycine radical enzyme activase [Treponema sp.]|jgi:pyruvate formate lyase activating enzyme|nr:YjjW family glycine radical enzyme activase [Treponema sp.]
MQDNNGGPVVRAPVNRILRSSIVDGPGNRAAVFLQGCNYDCLYCHNPETISLCRSCGVCVKVCPTGALQTADSRNPGGGFSECTATLKVRWKKEKCVLCDACLKVCPCNSSPRVRFMTPKEVMAEIEPSMAFIRGVTVSGGECTLYPDFLRVLGRLVREKSLTFFLDSNGNYDYPGDPALMSVADAVMLDIKANPADETEYSRVTGRSGGDLFEKMNFLARTGKLWEVRTVVSPGLFDAPALVEKVCDWLAKSRAASPAGIAAPPQYKLIRYRSVGVRPAAAATLVEPDEDLMDALAAICTKHGIKAVVV